MLLQNLIGEFEHEVGNTRKLLLAVPQKDIRYKPSDISWTMGELAQHIATIYYWYVGTFTQDVYDLAATIWNAEIQMTSKLRLSFLKVMLRKPGLRYNPSRNRSYRTIGR